MICPYCKETKFFEGPSGGVSTNVLCANPECRHWFNYQSIFDKLEDLHRVEPSDEEKERGRIAAKQEILEEPEKQYQKGIAHYISGKSAKEMLSSKPLWPECTGADFYKLAGYIDAGLKALQKN